MSWHGIMKVLEIHHLNANGDVLWRSTNLKNILHQDGEEFILRAVFTGGQESTVIPENYYLGLDNRPSPVATDTMDDLLGEPQAGGYERQDVASSGDFTVVLEGDNFVVTSPIVAFRATAATWGPVRNLFLTDRNDNTGYLISTIALPSPISVILGDSVTMRIGMQLRECEV